MSRTDRLRSAAVRRFSSASLWRGPPSSPPLRRLPTLGDVDRLTGDLLAPKLEDAHPEVPRAPVVADRDLRNPEITSASDLPELDGCARRVVASPFAEVLNSDEALARLRELENCVVVVHRVT